MERPLYDGTADVPIERPTDSPHDPLVPVMIRLERLRALADCLGDSLKLAGNEYSRYIGDRAAVCDVMIEEIKRIETDLQTG
jgi:hypothetical protein